jgi:predicted SAM-dependent methyltransferase
MLKVDLGGYARNGEWLTVNIDDELRAAPDHLADITARAAELDALFEPGSIDMIRCVHVLEHLDSGQMLPSLAYWRRFLKPSGKLLIVVPSMGALAIDYADGTIPMDVFAAVAYVPPSRIKGHVEELHKWGFDAHTLTDMLREAGYVNIADAGDAWWPRTWTLDFTPDLDHTGLVGRYEVPNLRILAENPE